MVEQIKRLTTSDGFNRFILVMIVLSGVLVGFRDLPRLQRSDAHRPGRHLVQYMILWIFVAEIVLKIAACGNRPWDYFRRGWNVFDFVIIVDLLPAARTPSSRRSFAWPGCSARCGW